MLTIHKFPVEIQNMQRVDMPAGASVLSVGAVRGDLFVWALVDTTRPMKAVPIAIRGTGADASDVVFMRFLGTVQEVNAIGITLVWHVFVGKQAD